MEALRPQFGLSRPIDPQIPKGHHKNDTQANRIQPYGGEVDHEYVASR